MNQTLIDQLLHKAGARFGAEGTDYSSFTSSKFAELIVAECINIVDEQKECLHEEQKYWHDRDYGYALAVDDAGNGIKQFFGVEE